jgi:hypothetical protein
MAFNLAKYNINPFNTAGDRARWYNATGAETVMALVGSALEIYPYAIGNENVRSSLSGLPTHFVSGTEGYETVLAEVGGGQTSIMLESLLRETVTGSADVVANIMPYPVGTEAVTAETSLGAEISLTQNGTEAVTADTSLGADISVSAEGFELISESASLEIVDMIICSLNVALAPGQKLVIDADSYTVLLDGENAIEIQSGDWIDELDRATTDISVRASAYQANLTSSIIYTERYL